MKPAKEVASKFFGCGFMGDPRCSGTEFRHGFGCLLHGGTQVRSCVSLTALLTAERSAAREEERAELDEALSLAGDFLAGRERYYTRALSAERERDEASHLRGLLAEAEELVCQIEAGTSPCEGIWFEWVRQVRLHWTVWGKGRGV